MPFPSATIDHIVRDLVLGRLSYAFTAIRTLIPEGDSETTERLDSLLDTYRRGLEYSARGVIDPNAGTILGWLQRSLLTLLYDMRHRAYSRQSNALYYTRGLSTATIAEAVYEWHQLPTGTDSTMATERLFEAIWTTRTPSAEEIQTLLNIESPYLQGIILSAMTLALDYYPTQAYIAYFVSTLAIRGANADLRARALVGIVIASAQCWSSLLLPEALVPLTSLAEHDPELRRDLYTALHMTARLAEPESESKDISDTLRQSMSAIDPDTLRRMQSLGEEGISLEERERLISDLDASGVAGNMERIDKLLRSGQDLFYGSFAQTKGHPFFRRLMSWWLPFSVENPLVARMQERIPNLLQTYESLSGMICDSDCYSLILMLESFPGATMNIQVSDMIPGGGEMPEAIGTPIQRRLQSYLAGIMRFCRLYDRRIEHSDYRGLDTPQALEVHLALFPDSQLRAEMAKLYHQIGQSERALTLARMLYHEDPADEARAHFLLSLLTSQGLWSEALEVIEVLRLIVADESSLLLQEGLCLLHLGRHALAITRLRAISPEDDTTGATILQHIASAHLALHEWRKALETTYEYELRYDTTTPALLAVRATSMAYLGRTPQAFDLFESLPSDALTESATLMHAHTAFALGHHDRALQLYRMLFARLEGEAFDTLWADSLSLIRQHPDTTLAGIIPDAIPEYLRLTS